ncbi:phosphotransferase-like protein [Demetria terragena]|uniref:phosphotransferase-like protein n=1 Tax=Demetria terragena TaxID=63959 RepID=UPI0003A48F3D|nr:AAA family ATPase [Demetria terragena]
MGRLVLLNGPSSVGKSTAARAFADAQATPWLVLPVDLFHAQRSRPDLTVPQHCSMTEGDWQTVLHQTRAAYHRALAGAAAAGMDVVGDHVLNEPWRLVDLLDVTQGLDVFLVHLRADLDTLERRERERGDRQVGTARIQQNLVYDHVDCDLELDTTRRGPLDLASAITALMTSPPRSRAFDRLRTRQPRG